MTDAQLIECFHLAFLQVLTASADGRRHILKGGANLRYFFKSVRYSEDIDIDAVFEPGAGWRILAGRTLPVLLRAYEVEIGEVTKPEQTETTRRWKIQLRVDGVERVRTRVEFSNRNGDERHELDAVPERVVAPYGVRPPTVRHYLAPAAITQKVDTLGERAETQARDVFDLDHLFRLRPNAVKPGEIPEDKLLDASARALSLDYDAFVDQVLPFLDPDVAELYDQDAWDRIQTYVIGNLEGLR